MILLFSLCLHSVVIGIYIPFTKASSLLRTHIDRDLNTVEVMAIREALMIFPVIALDSGKLIVLTTLQST